LSFFNLVSNSKLLVVKKTLFGICPLDSPSYACGSTNPKSQVFLERGKENLKPELLQYINIPNKKVITLLCSKTSRCVIQIVPKVA